MLADGNPASVDVDFVVVAVVVVAAIVVCVLFCLVTFHGFSSTCHLLRVTLVNGWVFIQVQNAGSVGQVMFLFLFCCCCFNHCCYCWLFINKPPLLSAVKETTRLTNRIRCWSPWAYERLHCRLFKTVGPRLLLLSVFIIVVVVVFSIICCCFRHIVITALLKLLLLLLFQL